MKKQLILFLISLGILLTLLYLSDVRKVIGTLIMARFEYVLLALLLWFFDAILRTLRWNYLLKKVGVNLSFNLALKIFIPSLFLSNLTPGKIGEPVRSVFLKRLHGDRISVTLPSILIERFFDVLAMIIISFFGLFFLNISKIFNWLIASILFYTIFFSLAFFILLSKKRVTLVVGKLFSLFSFVKKAENFEKKILNFSIAFNKALKHYGKIEIFFLTFIYSLIIWIVEGVILFLAFFALGLQISLIVAIVAISISVLISVVTFLPGGLGSQELITIAFISSMYYLSMDKIMAALFLGRIVSFWMYALVGALLLLGLK